MAEGQMLLKTQVLAAYSVTQLKGYLKYCHNGGRGSSSVGLSSSPDQLFLAEGLWQLTGGGWESFSDVQQAVILPSRG